MSVVKDAIAAMKEVLVLSEKVDQAGSVLSDLAKEVREHDRRLVRLETMVEIAQVNKLTDVVIAKSGQPMARLVSLNVDKNTRSGVRFGLLKGEEIAISDGFHQPLTDDDLLG